MKLLYGWVTVFLLILLAHSFWFNSMQCILSINYCWPFGIQHRSTATQKPTVITNKTRERKKKRIHSHTHKRMHTYKVSKSTEKVITKLWFYGCINHFLLLWRFASIPFFSLFSFKLPKSIAFMYWNGGEKNTSHLCYTQFEWSKTTRT